MGEGPFSNRRYVNRTFDSSLTDNCDVFTGIVFHTIQLEKKQQLEHGTKMMTERPFSRDTNSRVEVSNHVNTF